MRFLTIPLLVVIASAAFAQNSVEGRWKITGAKMPKGSDASATFTKGRLAIHASGLRGGRRMTVDASGTYTYGGGQLVTKLTDASMDPTPFTPAERKQMFSPEGKASFKRAVLRNPSPAGKVRFLSKDKFTLTSKKGDVSTFTRIR